MGKKHPAVEEARDLRNAMEEIGRALVDIKVTPKGRIYQAIGILRMFSADTTPSDIPARFRRKANVKAEQPLFGAVPAGTGE